MRRALSLLILAACSGGTSDPKASCNDLVTALCDRLLTCYDWPSAEVKANNKLACLNRIYSEVPCSRVTGVKSTYNQCYAEATSLDCGLVREKIARQETIIPTICQGVLVLQPQAGPSALMSTSVTTPD